MRYILVYILLLFFTQVIFAQSFELYKGKEMLINKTKIRPGDTINKSDAKAIKQGVWIIANKTNGQLDSDGVFQDGKREGVWRKYFNDGTLKSEITYVANVPNGFAKLYYENGKLSEEGIWKGDKWVGNYKYYHENGNPCYEWSYNQNGERTGEQKYYHDNGNLKIIGNWQNGKESGTIKEYHDDGTLKAEKTFADGKIDVTTVKEYPKKETNNNNNNQVSNTTKDTTSVTNTNNNTTNEIGVFTGNGFHKTYNTKWRKIEREGYFINGKLVTGKHYLYDEEGNLVRLLEYKDGERISDERFDIK